MNLPSVNSPSSAPPLPSHQQGIRTNITALIDNLKGTAKPCVLTRARAALYLWEHASGGKKQTAELATDAFATACVRALNAGEADPDGPATRAVVTALVARVATASEEFAAMLIPAGAIDALCAVCVRHSEGGEAFDASSAVAAATETMRELAKSTALRPALRTALDVRALVETARYVPRRAGATSAGAADTAGDDDSARNQSREDARKFALTTMRALADPDKNDDAADFRARLRAGDGGHRDGISALASCLEAPDADVAIGTKEHAARVVADLAFDEGPCRDEILGCSGLSAATDDSRRRPSLGNTLRSIVASRSTPSLKLKAAAACAMWRATSPSGFTAEDAARTSERIGSLVRAKGVLEGAVRLLRKPTKEETKPPPTAAEEAAAEEAAAAGLPPPGEGIELETVRVEVGGKVVTP